MDVFPLHPSIGTEVRGLELGPEMPPDIIEQLKELWHERHVLLFREQTLDDAAQVAFSKHFGTLEILPEPEQRAAAHPEIFRIANTDEAGNIRPPDDPIGVYMKIVEHWHTDSAYREIPSFGAILRSLAVPPEGGQTQFVNLLDAFATLPAALRDAVQGRRIVCSYEKTRAVPGEGLVIETDEVDAHRAAVMHPIVRRHPDREGQCSLYLSPVNMIGIEGLQGEAAEQLLDELLAWVTQECFVYTHQWQAGDVLIWDNRCTMHRVLAYDSARFPRVMHRTALVGVERVFAP